MKQLSKKAIVVFISIIIGISNLWAQIPIDKQYTKEFRQALALFEAGMFSNAELMFDNIYQKYKDANSMGYSVLCSEFMQSPNYEKRIETYSKTYPYSGMLNQIYYRYGLNLFNEGNYLGAASIFDKVNIDDLLNKNKAEYLFKKGYSNFQINHQDKAIVCFEGVVKLKDNDFSAPAKYALGYINYERQNFTTAINWFSQSVKDYRFADISNYYIAECKFMLKDYQYLANNAQTLFESVPDNRKPRIARMISESLLVLGKAQEAKRYYDTFREDKVNNREDAFYAGSLLYALKDYVGAIEKFSLMKERTDSLGQIANYQMGYSYIKTKNKVAALEAFKMAATQDIDKHIQEDAYFNYAKLSFDLNKDGSVFKSYMQKYPTKAKSDLIYSYIALAALYDHNYAAAVDAYDEIDDLDPNMKSNYMKANYLRANQLINMGAYRDASSYLKVAIAYSDKYSMVNQLAKYWLAQAYYRDGDYQQACQNYKDLYNLSALYGKNEGDMIPYNIGYSYFNMNNYNEAIKWFNTYINQGNMPNKKDALIRIADIDFLNKNYQEAAETYVKAIDLKDSINSVYPYYQAGISYGLSKNLNKKIDILSQVKNANVKDELYADSMYELARAYADAKMDNMAMDCYKDIIKANIDSTVTARALLGMGIIERNRNNDTKALEYYKEVVRSMPKTEWGTDALIAIESIYQTIQKPEEYIAYIDSLGDKSNKTPKDKEQILFNGAEQLFLSGNYDKALNALLSYAEKYKDNDKLNKVYFYIAECYKHLNNKDKACDYYAKVMNSNSGAFTELSALNYAQLSYSMEQYNNAYSGYDMLNKVAKMQENKNISVIGLMSSAYLAANFTEAISWADKLISSNDKALAREAQFIKAKSLLSISKRKEAFAILNNLAKSPKTTEGAEASYLIIMDNYDRGDFANVEKLVFKFADAAPNQSYWLAKSFIVLGDSYVEQNDLDQAKATFESIKNGYKPKSKTDEVLDNVDMRLSKLAEYKNR